MKRKFLTTTLVSMSLLSLNLFAGTEKCTGNFCMVDLSKNAPSAKRQEVKKDIYEYETVMLNNIETIVFSPEKYIMTGNELGEYDLEQMKMLNNLSIPVLTDESLVIGCEDNLKAVKVAGVANTYECA